MAKIIHIPTTRSATAFYRVNTDQITYYDGTWIYLNGQHGRISQTISSDELDELIALAESNVKSLIPVLS